MANATLRHSLPPKFGHGRIPRCMPYLELVKKCPHWWPFKAEEEKQMAYPLAFAHIVDLQVPVIIPPSFVPDRDS